MSSISDINRLRWRCRRGMREMDIVLGGFLEQQYEAADSDIQQAFVRILDELDQDILDWIMARRPCPAEYRPLVERLRLVIGDW